MHDVNNINTIQYFNKNTHFNNDKYNMENQILQINHK